MAEFHVPDAPADGDLYNELLAAEVHVADVRRRYHEAECAQLEAAWRASNTTSGQEGSGDAC
jgi:hypothetical protein